MILVYFDKSSFFDAAIIGKLKNFLETWKYYGNVLKAITEIPGSGISHVFC